MTKWGMQLDCGHVVWGETREHGIPLPGMYVPCSYHSAFGRLEVVEARVLDVVDTRPLPDPLV